MKLFTMKGCTRPAELSEDEKGRLYDKRIRHYLDSFLQPEQVRRMEPFAALKWLAKEMQQLSRQSADRHDLSEGRFQLMMRLRFEGPTHLGELADQLHVSPRNITGLVDHLESDGLVERISGTVDRRSIQARLTAKGRALVEKIWQNIVESNLNLTESISQEELDQFRHTCFKLIRAIEERK
ncbi:MAG: MarR family winged helix-turn-helix transcriptional regulator [Candidatus Dormibacteraceae bacterium]